MPSTPVAPIASPASLKCPVQGCGQTRIADDCSRRKCRKHCIEQGSGCLSKKHKVAASLPLLPTVPPLPVDCNTAQAPLPLAEVAFLPPQSTPTTVPSSNQPLDARPDPRFTSHLRPIYVDSLAREQALELAKSKLDAERIASAKQAAQKVTVHAWVPNATEPESRQIQKGFIWPFFKLSTEILTLLELQHTVESGSLQVYDEVDGYWVTIDIDHVMEVREGQCVYLRDRSVKVCQGFDDLFKPISYPHLRNNLAQERAYVRNAWKGLSSSPQKRKATSPPSPLSFSSPVKREFTPSPFRDISPSPIPVTMVAPLETPALIVNPTSDISTPSTYVGSAENPIELSDCDEKQWPRDYYTCDVARCFRDAKTSVRGARARTAAIIFQEHFPGLKFNSSTYSDHKKIWRKAPTSLQNHYLVIGPKRRGLWSAFVADAKRGNTPPSLAADVIELSGPE